MDVFIFEQIMKKEELRNKLFTLCAEWHGVAPKEMVDDFMQLINQHVKDVIGEDATPHNDHTDKDEWYGCIKCMENNPLDGLRAEQRKRAQIK